MIVLDTTVLVYAVGTDHGLREPCRDLIEATTEGRIEATTSVEAIQEFVHVRARRRPREDAAALGREYATLLSPLLEVSAKSFEDGLAIYEATERLGAFDAVLAAAAIDVGASGLVSADGAFGEVPGLAHIEPTTRAIAELLRED